MGTIVTSDFRDWLNQIDFSDYDDVYDLYHAVSSTPLAHNTQVGLFQRAKAKGSDDRWIVKYGDADMIPLLLIPSEKARITFLTIIQETYCQGTSIEAFYAMQKSKERRD